MLIRGGLVASGKSKTIEDIRVENGIITEVSSKLQAINGEDVIDASGMHVVPGGIDAHTHMSLDLGNVVATDDFYSGSIAAACGGTTSIIDHMGFGKEGSSIKSQVDHYHELADDNAVIDYSFHGVMNRVDDSILQELADLVNDGITSHKFYLTYGGKISDREVLRLMERSAELGIMLCVHAENDSMIAHLSEKFISEGKLTPKYHPLSRPIEAEAEAVERMLLFAKIVGDVPLYMVHQSSALSVSLIDAARSCGQKHIYAETCPQYLFLDDSYYERDDALKYIMSPPLRAKENNDLLWRYLQQNTIDVVATDHCPFFYRSGAAQKQLGAENFSKTPGGAPGVETRMGLIYSKGVVEGRISLEQFVRISSENPAKIFGIYPKKGSIRVGSDADITIMDPEKKVVINQNMLHENVDYTPYEGFEQKGWPIMTISRGEIVAKEGEFLGKKGRGRFIKRSIPCLEQ